MNQLQKIHQTAQKKAGKDAKALRDMAVFAHQHKNDDDALDAIAEGYGCRVEPYILMVELAPPELFNGRVYDRDNYLAWLKLCRMNKFDRAIALKHFKTDITFAELSLALVSEYIDGLKEKRRKTPLKDKLRALIVELDAASVCGAGLEVVCTRRMVADKLREMLE